MKLARVMGEPSQAAFVVEDKLVGLGGWSSASLADHAIAADLGGASIIGAPTFLAPVEASSKVICLGLNYHAHRDEVQAGMSSQPALFTKFTDALVGHEEALACPSVSTHYDYEGELAVVIGRPGRHIASSKAMEHVFGYTIMLDGSVRDYQNHSVSAGKNFWRSGALGPWIVTADEVGDPAGLTLETRLNGELVQSATTDLMIHDVASIISYVSRWTPLAPGDVIAMGTPAGVGAMRSPPLWMRPGDVIEVLVSGIGTLRNHIVDEASLL